MSPGTLSAYQSAIDHVIGPHFGQLQVAELNATLLDETLAELDEVRSTDSARTVLSQMLGLAVRRGMIDSNFMRDVEATAWVTREIQHLDVQSVHRLRLLLATQLTHENIDPRGRRQGGRPPNRDLCDVVDFALGTGARGGECLAVRVRDLHLDADVPVVDICGTLIQPRKGYIEQLHRQPETK